MKIIYTLSLKSRLLFQSFVNFILHFNRNMEKNGDLKVHSKYSVCITIARDVFR